MITIKLPYKTNFDFTKILKQYSSIVRYSYNRFLNGKNEKEIRLLTKSLNNIELLNSWMIQCGIREGKQLHTRFNDKKIIFGGKNNFIKKLQNKISKDEYQLKRLIPLNIQGEVLQKGNRCFNLDIIENNKIIFKLNRNLHIDLQLPKLRNNIKKEVTNFIEVFCNAPLKVCEQRDTKGLYEKARRGEIQNFTGISDPYEAPENPDIELHTDKETIEESTNRVIDYFKENEYI